MTTESTASGSRERADLLESLQRHRGFLRHTVQGLDDEQARKRTTVSALCLGGLVKHVAFIEEGWADFIVRGAVAMDFSPERMQEHSQSFDMLGGETLQAIIDRYDDVARRTDALVKSVASLDDSHPLPEAPWFEPGAAWSARRVFLHMIAETAQHAGHADIIREALDGQKTMG